MNDSKSFNNNVIRGSEKSFGIVFGVVFLIITAYRFYKYSEINYLLIIISLVFFIFAFLMPKIFKLPNIIWFYLGILLSKIFFPIFLSLIFFIIITPTGFFMRSLKGNYIDKKIDKQIKTYWIKRDKNIGSFKDQF